MIYTTNGKMQMNWFFEWKQSVHASDFTVRAINCYINQSILQMANAAAGNEYAVQQLDRPTNIRHRRLNICISTANVDGIQRVVEFERSLEMFISTINTMDPEVDLSWEESMMGMLYPRVVQDVHGNFFASADIACRVIRPKNKDICIKNPYAVNGFKPVKYFVILGETNKVNELTGVVRSHFEENGTSRFAEVESFKSNRAGTLNTNQALILGVDEDGLMSTLLNPVTYNEIDIGAINEFLKTRNIPILNQVEFH